VLRLVLALRPEHRYHPPACTYGFQDFQPALADSVSAPDAVLPQKYK
jgi:hypothetical protein